jgi:hypothetical protein
MRNSNLYRTRCGITIAAVASTLAISFPARAQSLSDLVQRLDKLEQENRDLRSEIELLKAKSADNTAPTAPLHEANVALAIPATAANNGTASPDQSALVQMNSAYTFAMLDATAAGKSKPLHLLTAKRDNQLSQHGLYIGGALTAMADYQTSNFTDDFGYLMRHPGANHVGKTVSEIVLHSAQVQLTGNVAPWVSAYVELLYDPQQSFGSGSITALSRNQVQVRRGYVVLGDLAKSPFYAVIGKLDSPFGQTDTVNPFTLSTDWHSFSGLSYGGLLGYSDDRLNVSLEAVQGGAQFRGLNTPVEGTNTPSKINNYVVDVNYTTPLGAEGRSLLIGASYERGSSFCQTFPITHFGTCTDPNPAYALYGTLHWDQLEVKGDFAKTTHAMPGTFNPNPPLNIYPAHRITSFDVGARYRVNRGLPGLALSLDYSTLIAGPKGAPWHRQDQWVAGVAASPQPNLKFFSEAILVKGYLPFNFLTGGTPGDTLGTTESSTQKNSTVLLMGINAAF